MNYQVRAFQISFLLHILIVACVVICSTFMGQHKKTMVIDFDLREAASASAGKKTEAAAPLIKPQSIHPEDHKNLKTQESLRLPQDVSPVSPVTEIARAEKIPERNDAKNLTAESGIAAGVNENSIANSGTGNSESAKETARIKYLNHHFAYIRDRILGNVAYPDKARRMGWQGKVVLSFIITADGSVRAFKIIQSSGFNMLDKSAVASVREAAPFPKPPVEAELVIPIAYRLE